MCYRSLGSWRPGQDRAGEGRLCPPGIASPIEAGYPLFGVDMTEETIPLEAGIEDRAISLSKECYVGEGGH